MTGRIFSLTLVAASSLIIFSCSVLCAETPKELTGDDWMRMLQDEKLEFVSVALKAHESQGLAATKPSGYYVYALNSAIMGNAEYESENVTDILNGILYQNEPSFQPQSKKSQSPIQKIEMH